MARSIMPFRCCCPQERNADVSACASVFEVNVAPVRQLLARPTSLEVARNEWLLAVPDADKGQGTTANSSTTDNNLSTSNQALELKAVASNPFLGVGHAQTYGMFVKPRVGH